MPKASKQSASESETVEGYEGHFEHFDGGYSVAFETYTQDADLAPFFKGLPGDRCQAAHWGYVLKRKVAYHFDDRTEVVEAGMPTTCPQATRQNSSPTPRSSSSAQPRSCSRRLR